MSNTRLIRVREVMNPDIDRVDGIITVSEALRDMQHLEARAMIVNKRHADDEFGMVLLSDIARQVLAQDRSPERVNIYEIMIKPVISVSPEMDIRYCARLFEHFRLSRTPVMEHDNVIGIVSFTDLVLRGMTPNL